MATINELIKNFLTDYKSDSSQLDVQLILAHVMQKPRTWIASHGDATPTSIEFDSAQQAFSRLKAGEPLPYILGHWEFFSLDFDLTSDVLIPRPETELLAEKAIEYLNKNPERRTVADIGTGSAAIAISIAKNIPDANILATDISPKVLKVAKQNAKKHGAENKIEFIECDLLPQKSSRQSKIDILCANLPYIPTSTLQTLPIFGHEPTLALDGGTGGLELYRKLFDKIPQWMSSNGVILIEIEANQGKSATDLAQSYFANATINLYQDLSGKHRILEIIL